MPRDKDVEQSGRSTAYHGYFRVACDVLELERIGVLLPSPGAVAETSTLYCARVDSAIAGGIRGLIREGEDILVRVVRADEAIAQALGGDIVSAYGVVPLLWLGRNRERLRERWRAR